MNKVLELQKDLINEKVPDSQMLPCDDCNGTGEVLIRQASNEGGVIRDEETGHCEFCDGSGEVPQCATCLEPYRFCTCKNTVC
jgi:DnaJ-class molecular chaperone